MTVPEGSFANLILILSFSPGLMVLLAIVMSLEVAMA
jgi:hypothetical protein